MRTWTRWLRRAGAILSIPGAAVALWIGVDQLRAGITREGPLVSATTTRGTFYVGREAQARIRDGRRLVPVSTSMASRLQPGDHLRLEVSPTFERVRAVTLLRGGDAVASERGFQLSLLSVTLLLQAFPLVLLLERKVPLGLTLTFLLALMALLQIGYGLLHLFPSLDTPGPM